MLCNCMNTFSHHKPVLAARARSFADGQFFTLTEDELHLWYRRVARGMCPSEADFSSTSAKIDVGTFTDLVVSRGFAIVSTSRAELYVFGVEAGEGDALELRRVGVYPVCIATSAGEQDGEARGRKITELDLVDGILYGALENGRVFRYVGFGESAEEG